MVRYSVRLVVIAGLLALVGVWGGPVAVAHAHNTIRVGPYDFAVGWTNEPPYAGQMNSLELEISNHESGEPVADAEQALTFEVLYGGQTMRIPLVPGEEPGHYSAPFLPTQRGQYSFHFVGKLGDEAVDLTVEVEEVANVADVSFPQSGGAADPVQAELSATRMLALGGLATGGLGLVVGIAAAMMARAKRA